MTRRILIAALLMGVVLWLSPRLFPVPPKPVVRDTAAATAAGPSAATVATPNGPAGTTSTATSGSRASDSARSNTAAAPPVRAETTVVADSVVQARFSSFGASFANVTLTHFHSRRKGDTSPVELARPRESLLSYQLATPRDTVRLDALPFTPQRPATPGSTSVVEYSTPSSVGDVTVRYALEPGSYVTHVTGSVKGAPPGTSLLVTLPQGLRSAEADTSDDVNHLAIAYKRAPDDAKGVAFHTIDAGERQLVRGPIEWAVTKSKYFLVAVIAPDSAAPFGDLVLTGGPRLTKQATHMTGVLSVPLKDGAFAFDVYAGPQEWRRLRAMGHELDTANPYGGFLQPVVQPFATVVMRVLLWMHEKMKLSYGWVLVLFGVAVRLLTWPLNQSAMRTSLKMQRIQPELAEIQRRYKKDPQRLNEEMMKLYRQHGMSPFSSLSGCMPMLIPMPVLFALFFVFQNTIEFRGVPFLWLPDISIRDPLYILPVLMGLSMFLLSWIGMRNAPPNPQAKMMAYVMPVVMTAIFFRFPSGLNLYYTVQNIVTLPQQWLLSKERAKTTATAPVVAPVTGGRRRPAT
jgi:YidC/Oxa1 family membrane protein insertase